MKLVNHGRTNIANEETTSPSTINGLRPKRSARRPNWAGRTAQMMPEGRKAQLITSIPARKRSCRNKIRIGDVIVQAAAVTSVTSISRVQARDQRIGSELVCALRGLVSGNLREAITRAINAPAPKTRNETFQPSTAISCPFRFKRPMKRKKEMKAPRIEPRLEAWASRPKYRARLSAPVMSAMMALAESQAQAEETPCSKRATNIPHTWSL